MGGHGHSDKTLPREDLTDEELRDLCITAVRQHRDEMRLWVSMRSLGLQDVQSQPFFCFLNAHLSCTALLGHSTSMSCVETFACSHGILSDEWLLQVNDMLASYSRVPSSFFALDRAWMAHARILRTGLVGGRKLFLHVNHSTV